jgi:hypothetical protein
MRGRAVNRRRGCRCLHLGLPGDAVSGASNFLEGLPLQKCTECRRVRQSENLRDMVGDAIAAIREGFIDERSETSHSALMAGDRGGDKR